MTYADTDLSKDVERVNKIPLVATILNVICETTGLRFAAVARVTQGRWIACSVRDTLEFGLAPGDELNVETTICDEIRDDRQPVIIDHVQTDAVYCNHPTPTMYGFQSYISFPIILKNGDFFGTLCALDPRPAQLNNPKVIDMFSMFAELIAFHLQNLELMERSEAALQTLSQQLTEKTDENRQYRHISNHNLQEPLRKIMLFSGMLLDATERNDGEKTRQLAVKINTNAQKFSMIIKGLTRLWELEDPDASAAFEAVDLNQSIDGACSQLSTELADKQAIVHVAELPTVQAIPWQLEQLFYHLLHNAVKFAKKDEAPAITITCNEISATQVEDQLPTQPESSYVEVRIQDNGIGIEQPQLDKIFNIFSQLTTNKVPEGRGLGLAYCRKIIRNHAGLIRAQSEVGKGTTFSILLPLTQAVA